MPAVLVSASSRPGDLRELLAKSGFAVIDHVLGSIPAVDFSSIAVALVDVGEKSDSAIAQTRRWRAELGDELVPIVWLVPASDPRLATRGLEAGADAILTRPLDAAQLTAQVHSAARCRDTAARVAARAGEARLLGEHLQKAHAEIYREQAALRRVRLGFLQRTFPDRGPARFAVVHRPRRRTGGDFYEVTPIDREGVAFLVGDVIGPGAASELLGHFTARMAHRLAVEQNTAGDILADVNRELLGLGLDDLPLVGLVLGIFAPTGDLSLARAGMPEPVYLPSEGAPEAWGLPGPFLCTAESAYSTRSAVLAPGDRLLIGSDGIRASDEGEPAGNQRLVELADRHRQLAGQPFIDAIARDLLSIVRHDDDFTLMVMEVVRR